MRQFNYEEFNSKSWSKRSSYDLRKYISQAIKDINRRNLNDKVTKAEFERLGKDITGFTKNGNLSARMIGKTKEELMYEARQLHNFLSWDYTSDAGQRELQGKYREAYEKFKNIEGNEKYDQRTYEIYVEMMNAFSDLSMAYDSAQIREWIDTVEESKGVLTYRDLQKAMLEYADEVKKGKTPEHTSLQVSERNRNVTQLLEQLIKDRTPKE